MSEKGIKMRNKRKLAVSTLSFQKWEIEELAALLQKNGIQGMELRLGLSSWSMQDMTDEEILRLKAVLAKNQICITDLGTSVCIAEYREEALHSLENDMKFACRLGVKGLRIMLGYFRTTWSETVPAIDYEGILKWLREADSMAGTYGCQIWIETHYEFSTGRMLHKLFSDCCPKNCRILWDVMHPLEQGELPEETYGYIKDYLVHVHIKDGLPWPDDDRASWKYTKVGDGLIPLKEFLHLLAVHGYDGYYSLEWEPMWHAEIQGNEYQDKTVISEFSRYMRKISDWSEDEDIYNVGQRCGKG